MRLARAATAALLATLIPGTVLAATALADQPIASGASVPGNLAFTLSVEDPTAVTVAHPDTTYASASVYLGYFDPDKCYLYEAKPEIANERSHFYPAGIAASHTCTGANDQMWSGNFLNWVTMQTIDPFRWALTGGYRSVDTASLTLLEKAWGTYSNPAYFPNRMVTDAAVIAGATPFTGSSLQIRVFGLGNRITLSVAGATGSLYGTYFNNTTLSGTPVLTRFETVDFDWGGNAPGPGVNSDNFSARWTANSTAPTTGSYLFQTRSDDGVRLYVNGTLVIDNWTTHSPTTNTSASIALNAGDRLDIRLEYFESLYGAEIRLNWKPPGASGYTPYRPPADAYNTGSSPPYADPQLFVRVKVCDATAPGGVESNCIAYPSGYYKPEGLMQQYADRIRYSVFGYLTDASKLRDGGVLRAQQKFIGKTKVVPGSPATTVANTGAQEWSSSDGTFIVNPDASDAAATASAYGITIADSGAMNYINKFGQSAKLYKSNDPVGELYYAAIRYFKNQGNVAAWSSMSGASAATKAQYADGFPVITTWNDPVQYSCQRNFVLGIGDVETHADKNVPGATGTASEPTKPPEVTADTTVDAIAATNKVGNLQGITNLASMVPYLCPPCTANAPYMAGLAYDANTRDIRPDLTGTQTVQTFFVDVLAYGIFKTNNQFYLAAKYGGFKVPKNYDAYGNTTPLPQAWWSTTGDTVGTGTSGYPSQPRPDNYFTASRPDRMVSGLKQAFASINAQIKAYTTAFSSALPQVAQVGAMTYSTQYDPSSWTGEITASTTSFDAGTGTPMTVTSWLFSDKLAAQIGGSGWDTDRRVVTWNTTSNLGVAFRSDAISPDQKTLLNTVYRGSDNLDYLKYLRGDRTHEESSTAAGSSHAYRNRATLVGDIVNAKVRVVGRPSAPFSSAANPGYAAFQQLEAVKNRPTMLYAGSNAGMLHAVNGALSGSDAGREVFAYVPGALYRGPTATPVVNGLQSVGDPEFTHHYMVDGPQTVFDIDFGRTAGGSGTDWRSVLVGALGKGGKSYYAIDVTNPAAMTSETAVAGKVLWEFSHDKLGYTYGEPAAVKTRKHGWVLVFGSGYNNSDGQGYFFLVNPRTGALLQEPIPTGQGSTANDAGLAHVQAFVLDRTDNTADAIYAGDLLGNLWRLDVGGTGTYPAPVQLAQLLDSSNNPLPITSRPLAVVQPGTNRRFVTVGTGRLLAASDVAGTQSQAFFAVIDGTAMLPSSAATLPTGVTYPIRKNKLKQLTDLTQKVTIDFATQAGWWFDLGASAGQAWRTITDPASFNGIVAFTTMLPSSDACSPAGSSRVYAIDLGSGQSRLLSGTSRLAYLDTLAGLVTDLRFFSVNGTARLVVGKSNGDVIVPPGEWTGTLGARRLNWRELPLAD